MTMMTTTTTTTTATTTTWLLVVVTTVLLAFGGDTGQAKLRYLKGDILETPDTLGHDGSPYPREFIERLLVKENRRGRTLHPTMDPALVSRRLLRNFEAANEGRFSDVEGNWDRC
ncbi:uncharacterized protein LOC143035788 [Oratosquilla oratoria]|uniref:uncharacterized protein LOC143035788 n=1 Tax=Oratosquilla oratoria TaxID=337810 RepID=UPI003F75CBC2